MPVLGIETSTAVCGAAIVQDDRTLAEEEVEQKYVHAEQLLPFIDTVLTRCGITVGDLDGIAVSIGPGSFTGLRIGLSVAKGLVAATGRPLLAVPTLTALASRLEKPSASSAGAYILAALDARRDEVYCQLFAQEAGMLTPRWEPRDLGVEQLLIELGGRETVLTGDGRFKIAEVARRAGGALKAKLNLAHDECARCSASAVARLGAQMLAGGMIADPSALEPMYIKEFFLRTRQ